MKNEDVAAAWARGEAASAGHLRSEVHGEGPGNITVLYSYSMPIAKRFQTHVGVLYWVTDERRSRTTTAHTNKARTATVFQGGMTLVSDKGAAPTSIGHALVLWDQMQEKK